MIKTRLFDKNNNNNKSQAKQQEPSQEPSQETKMPNTTPTMCTYTVPKGVSHPDVPNMKIQMPCKDIPRMERLMKEGNQPTKLNK